MVKISRKSAQVYISEVQLDTSKLLYVAGGYPPDFKVANILVVYRHTRRFTKVKYQFDHALTASNACSALGINPNLVRIDGLGAYGLPSRSVPTMPDKKAERIMQNSEDVLGGFEHSSRPGTAKVLPPHVLNFFTPTHSHENTQAP